MMRFNKIYVEITNNCNLKCSFCSKDTRMKKEMSIDEFSSVVNKIKDYTKNIYLHVKGEPLLHSQLDKILSICTSNGLNVRLTTNGTLLNAKKDILLKNNIKQLNISLHCENSLPNYYENVFKACEELSKKMTVIYRIWVLDNLQLDKISTEIVEKIISYYKLSPNIVEKVFRDRNIELCSNIYLDKDNEFTWPNEEMSDSVNDEGYCLGTKNQIAILADGTVVPCCLDSNADINLGNILKDDLNRIINSELFVKINEGFRNHKVICSLCQKCRYRQRFEKE